MSLSGLDAVRGRKCRGMSYRGDPVERGLAPPAGLPFRRCGSYGAPRRCSPA